MSRGKIRGKILTGLRDRLSGKKQLHEGRERREGTINVLHTDSTSSFLASHRQPIFCLRDFPCRLLDLI